MKLALLNDRAYKLLAALSIFALVMMGVQGVFVSIADAQQSGAVWTTTGSCGDPQNVNHYAVGETVFINGSGFDADTQYGWQIKDPGNNGTVHISGFVTTDSNGDLCTEAVELTEDLIGGPYNAQVDGKNDNFSVAAQTQTSGTLTVIKSLENEPQDVSHDEFSFTINTDLIEQQFESDGSNDVVLNINDGPFTVVEVEANGDGYSTTYEGCSEIDLTTDGATCTITNTYDSVPVEGCTDENALNYDETATVDDDSCTYPVVTICKLDGNEDPLSGWDVYIEDDQETQYGGTTDGTGCVDVSDVPLGTYTLGETLQNGWENVSGNGDEVIVDDETETFTLMNREIPPENGQIIVVKEVTEGSNTQTFFSFSTSWGEDISLQDGDSEGEVLAPDTYSVSETVPEGWTLQDVTCVSSIDDSETAENIELDAGETVTCTFTNDEDEVVPEPGTIIVKKEVTEGSNTSAQFSFDPSWTEANFVLSDGQSEEQELEAGQYSVSEIVPNGWNEPQVSCVSSLEDNETADSIELDAGETVTCTFTNDEEDGGGGGGPDGSISGTKYDWSTEAQLEGWTIFIDENDNQQLDNGEQSDITDSDGNFSFTGLSDGTYSVCEVNEDGWIQQVPTTDNGCYEVVIEGGNASTQNDFWNERTPDAPECLVGENLLVNGSFEEPVADANSAAGGFWETFASITGWVSDNSFELWNNMFGGASDGDQNAELDVDGSSTISQDVATIPGATYELRFDFSPRPSTGLADNSVDALVDGSLLLNAQADGSSLNETDWTTYSDTFVASGATTSIALADVGSSNGTGSLVDNAVLCLVREPEPQELRCTITATKTNVDNNEPFVLNWTTVGASNVEISGIGTGLDLNGSAETSIGDDTNFVLTASNGEQSVQCDVYVRENGGGGGGGSRAPICESFDADVDGDNVTLTWETRYGFDIELTRDGEEIFATDDDDDVNDGTFETELNGAEEFELTVFRGIRSDSCTVDLGDGGTSGGGGNETPTPQVLGEQVSAVPAGAATTGAGGAAPSSTIPQALAFLMLVASMLTLRATREDA